MRNFLIASFPGLWLGIAAGLLGLYLAGMFSGCAANPNAEAAAVLSSPYPCFLMARDPQHVTCLNGARPVSGHPQYRGKLPNE